MKNLIKYFAERHTLSNVLFFGTILMAISIWFSIGKEEMPEFASNWIRVSTIYPGASAEDVELFVTKPIEEELKGVVGIEEIVTVSSVGSSSVRLTLDDDYPDKDEVIQEIKDATLRADLPSEVRDLPRFRQFKSAAKAILDIGIFHKERRFLDQKTREEIQKYVLGFESQVLSLNEISAVDISHYRKPELKILVDPKLALSSEISLSEIKDQIQSSNVRAPIGSMKDRGESKVTALNELETVDELKKVILRGNYEGKGIRLNDIATIEKGFESSNSVFKINGHEGVFLNVKKNVSTDILTARDAVMKFIDRFERANKDSPIKIVLMDDESYAVQNRLDIVTSNGAFGFICILIVLLLFLNVKTGFWVAMGIPFSAAFTLIIANLFDYTINNMTLAGVIIVLGIVVDDAIVVAENISRKIEEGLEVTEAAVQGTLEVIRPITASIITTCVAFLPLIFFEGFFGKLVSYIPLVVILMLIGSLLESLIILPSHLSGRTYVLDRFVKQKEITWFHKFEDMYEKFLLKAFNFRIPIIVGFLVFLSTCIFVYKNEMKFVMFPREESKEVFIKVKTRKGMNRIETAKAITPLEEIFVKDKKNVVAVRSSIGMSRRGGEVKENQASILVELIPADDRDESLDTLLNRWEKQSKEIKGLKSVRFLRGRWGHSSGSSIELQVQENNDANRAKIVSIVENKMKEMKSLSDVEIEEPLIKKEYLFKLKQDQLIKLNVTPAKVITTLRSFVEGSIIYSINKGEEEVDVRLTVPDSSKGDLKELLNLRVENKTGNLIYLRNVVEINEVSRHVNIKRTDFKRTTMIYANPVDGGELTPVEIAEKFEDGLFSELANKYPNAILTFKGEIEDTRESSGEFINSIIIVILVIYLILVVIFDSMFKPFFILSIVPFGVGAVIMILKLHGMSVFGFFAVIGTIGMIGVVVNDAIVMLDKIERSFEKDHHRSFQVIAKIASTRLRPVLLTTLTTVVGILPTAYGFAGYDSMLAEMMLTMGWGLVFGTAITLFMIPCLYTFTVNRQMD